LNNPGPIIKGDPDKGAGKKAARGLKTLFFNRLRAWRFKKGASIGMKERLFVNA
jgi:hypothetical protein